jgi:hypothetical protein
MVFLPVGSPGDHLRMTSCAWVFVFHMVFDHLVSKNETIWILPR